ncbi:MAG: DUF11 domain-containing protein [Chloroflexota bacterium]|nr:DUF11 domain-containing protein [Chloroflexota bacterium]
MLAVVGLILSMFAMVQPVLADPPVATHGKIGIFKTMCQEVGTQDTCVTGRDTSLNNYMIDFQVFAGTATSGTPVTTLTVTLGENENGQGNTGNGSQGRVVSDDLLLGTYTVCEVPVAYLGSSRVPLDPYPRPIAGGGGSTGGPQVQTGDNCITVTLTGGTAELKFLNLRGPEITVSKTGDALGKVTDPVSYSVTITNISPTVTAYKQSISDSLVGSLTTSSGCGASLAPGASCTISYSYTVKAGDPDPLVNTATAVYDRSSDLSGMEVTASDTHSVNLFQPGITVTKTATPASVGVGGTISYRISIRNTGSADSPALVFDTIADSLQGNLKASCSTTLAVGAECVITYTRPAGATAGQVCNTVSVTSHPDGFPNNITGSSTACVTVTSSSGTLGGNPTPTPVVPTPAPVVRTGTQGGVPNTAMEAPISDELPSALLALTAIVGLGYLGRRNLIAIRGRR